MLRLVARYRTGAYPKLLLGALIAAGCSNVLGIADPTPKPPDGGAGEGGEGPDASGGSQATSGSGGATAGGDAGSGNGGNGGSGGLSGQSGMAGAPSGAGEGGEAGAAADPCPIKNRCGGDSGKVPQVCDAGQWTTNTAESSGDCPVLCVDGKCVACTDGDMRCNANESQKCVNGSWQDQALCKSYCMSGACITPPSCTGLDDHPCAGGVSCCNALEVPGGSFIRDYDAGDFSNQSYTATVSSFLMDKFEVTVQRLKTFVGAYSGIQLKAGDGKSNHVVDDPGWQDSYSLPATSDDLKSMLSDANCPGTTWSDVAGGDLNLPANCVNFYVAYAFCIWDGGRLPTEAEWNYAAAGGSEQRVYPWSTPPDSSAITDADAFFNQVNGLPIDVGLKTGAGLWGQSDLAGNLSEWNLDYYAKPYPSTVCNDCVNMAVQTRRVVRGGSYVFDPDSIKVSARDNLNPVLSQFYVGFRCVHDLPRASP